MEGQEAMTTKGSAAPDLDSGSDNDIGGNTKESVV